MMTSAGVPVSLTHSPQSSIADMAIQGGIFFPSSGIILSRTAIVSGRSRLYQ